MIDDIAFVYFSAKTYANSVSPDEMSFAGSCGSKNF